MTTWGQLKQRMIEVRGSRCEVCGEPKLNDQLEAHHAIFGRRRGHPELDCPENMQLVCHECHQSGLNYRDKQRFWDRQIERGYDMVGWLDGLTCKVKPRF